MHKNNLLNLALLFLVASLASVIYFSKEENTLFDTLTHIKTKDIHTIVIQHKNNITTLKKQNNQKWQITQPVTIAANNFRINSVLQLLSAPVHKRYASNEVNLASIGLENSTTKITFNEQNIVFGDINPATSLRYIKMDGFIYTIEDVYSPLLSSHFGTLVSLNLLPENSEIEKLILINQTISKNKNAQWTSNINISADNINKTIENWTQSQAFGVHAYLQRDSLGEIFISLKNERQVINYVITDTDPWLILARPETGLEYHLDIKLYDTLIAPQ